MQVEFNIEIESPSPYDDVTAETAQARANELKLVTHAYFLKLHPPHGNMTCFMYSSGNELVS